MNRNPTETDLDFASPGSPDPEAEPFRVENEVDQANGTVSTAASAAIGEADGEKVDDSTNAPGGCRCGAAAHATEPGICARGHALPGNRRTVKHGLYAQQPANQEAWPQTTPDERQVLVRLRDGIIRELARYADASRTHPISAREEAHVFNLLDRKREIEDRIAAIDAAPSAEDGPSRSATDAVRKLARIFSNEPDLFAEFLTTLLEADRDACGPLRQQTRITLEQFELGLPRLRADDPDEVIL